MKLGILSNFPHLATAKRRTRTIDSLAGSKDSFPTTLFTDRACWVQPMTANEVLEHQRREIECTHKVYFTSDPGLSNTDELVVGGVSWLVKSVSDPDASAGLGVVWRVAVALP